MYLLKYILSTTYSTNINLLSHERDLIILSMIGYFAKES